MNVLVIVYELATGEEAERQSFFHALEDYSTGGQLTRTAWLIQTPRLAADVYEDLDRHLMPADRIFVAPVSGEFGYRNIDQDFGWFDGLFGEHDSRERDGTGEASDH